jgi:hypothetical protein
MIEELQRTMGVRVFMITGYRDEKGQLMKTWYVFLHWPFCEYLSKVYRHEADPKHGKKFTTAHPNWKSGTYELFGEYLNSQFREFPWFDFQKSLADSWAPAEEDDEDADSEEEDEIPHFVTDEHGYPTLPPVGHMNLDKQKVAIRLFLQIIYRACFPLSFLSL